MRLLAYCLMPNHWHLVVWPQGDGELSDFGHWLSLTHTQRWHAHYHDVGTGHLYQGRYKSFPIAQDEHFLHVCRYGERNPLRADLVRQAEDWRWGSLWQRQQAEAARTVLLGTWPVPEPADWLAEVNRPQIAAELAAVRRSVERGQPYGAAAWPKRAATRLGLESTFRPRGRPRKKPDFANISRFYQERRPGIVGPVFDLFNVFRYTHGDPESVGGYLAQLHKSLFDYDEVVRLLTAAGFRHFVVLSYCGLR
jgi:putative transposase